MNDEQGIIMVVVDLQNPKEKHWGALLKISAAGLWLKGLNLATFEDWVRQFTPEDDPTDRIGVATSFFPMHRVERVTMDEPMGEIASYVGMLEQRAGIPSAQRILESFRTPDLLAGIWVDGPDGRRDLP